MQKNAYLKCTQYHVISGLLVRLAIDDNSDIKHNYLLIKLRETYEKYMPSNDTLIPTTLH